MLFTDREVRIENNVAQGLECTFEVRVLQNEGKVFLDTDRPGPLDNCFFPEVISGFQLTQSARDSSYRWT